MFCPNCHTEFLEGVEECSDCHIQLVESLPEDPTDSAPDGADYEEILRTYNPIDLAMIRSLLEGAEIDFYFHGGIFNAMDPVAQPARLMVRKEHVAEAKEILKDLEIRFMIPFK
jgi:hypothetical protein